MRACIEIQNGNIDKGRDDLNKLVQNLPSGSYMVHFEHLEPRNPEEWRKYYFFLRDILFDEGETGYTRKEIHELAKCDIMSLMSPNYFFEMMPVLSTGRLTNEGWHEYVKLFKEWSFSKFNCYL